MIACCLHSRPSGLTSVKRKSCKLYPKVYRTLKVMRATRLIILQLRKAGCVCHCVCVTVCVVFQCVSKNSALQPSPHDIVSPKWPSDMFCYCRKKKISRIISFVAQLRLRSVHFDYKTHGRAFNLSVTEEWVGERERWLGPLCNDSVPGG